jgi:hypothetical protein
MSDHRPACPVPFSVTAQQRAIARRRTWLTRRNRASPAPVRTIRLCHHCGNRIAEALYFVKTKENAGVAPPLSAGKDPARGGTGQPSMRPCLPKYPAACLSPAEGGAGVPVCRSTGPSAEVAEVRPQKVQRPGHPWNLMGRMPMPPHPRIRPFSSSSLRLCPALAELVLPHDCY